MNLLETIDFMQATASKPAMQIPLSKHFDSQPGGEMECKLCSKKVKGGATAAAAHLLEFHSEIKAREFSQKKRKSLAKKGEAMPGGGFPIVNKEDLANAKQAIGRAKNPAAARRHINERAKALGEPPIGGGKTVKADQFSPNDRLNMPAPAGTKERADETWHGPGQIKGKGFHVKPPFKIGGKCGTSSHGFHRGPSYEHKATQMGHRLTLSGTPARRKGSPKLSAERTGYRG